MNEKVIAINIPGIDSVLHYPQKTPTCSIKAPINDEKMVYKMKDNLIEKKSNYSKTTSNGKHKHYAREQHDHYHESKTHSCVIKTKTRGKIQFDKIKEMHSNMPQRQLQITIQRQIEEDVNIKTQQR